MIKKQTVVKFTESTNNACLLAVGLSLLPTTQSTSLGFHIPSAQTAHLQPACARQTARAWE